jgi:hypothetical protein
VVGQVGQTISNDTNFQDTIQNCSCFFRLSESINKRSLLYWFKRLFLFRLIDTYIVPLIRPIFIIRKFYNIKSDKLKVFPYAIHFSESNRLDLTNEKRANELATGINLVFLFLIVFTKEKDIQLSINYSKSYHG